MPTIIRENGFMVRIYLKDHEPPHVHVFRGRDEVKIRLGDAQVKPYLDEIWGMKDRDSAKALVLIDKHQERLLEAWRGIYG